MVIVIRKAVVVLLFRILLNRTISPSIRNSSTDGWNNPDRMCWRGWRS